MKMQNCDVSLEKIAKKIANNFNESKKYILKQNKNNKKVIYCINSIVLKNENNFNVLHALARLFACKNMIKQNSLIELYNSNIYDKRYKRYIKKMKLNDTLQSYFIYYILTTLSLEEQIVMIQKFKLTFCELLFLLDIIY